MFNKDEHRKKYYSILFQMFVYAFLYKQVFEKSSDIKLSVYQLTRIAQCGPMTFKITDDQLDRFSIRLAVLLKEIKDKALTSNSSMEVCKKAEENCKYCDFNKYCRRSNRNEE